MDKGPRIDERKVRNGERRMNRSPMVKILTAVTRRSGVHHPDSAKNRPDLPDRYRRAGAAVERGLVRGSPAGMSYRVIPTSAEGTAPGKEPGRP